MKGPSLYKADRIDFGSSTPVLGRIVLLGGFGFGWAFEMKCEDAEGVVHIVRFIGSPDEIAVLVKAGVSCVGLARKRFTRWERRNSSDPPDAGGDDGIG